MKCTCGANQVYGSCEHDIAGPEAPDPVVLGFAVDLVMDAALRGGWEISANRAQAVIAAAWPALAGAFDQSDAQQESQLDAPDWFEQAGADDD
jgi:hypothetical protein